MKYLPVLSRTNAQGARTTTMSGSIVQNIIKIQNFTRPERLTDKVRSAIAC